MVVVRHDLNEIDVFLLQSKNIHGITDIIIAINCSLHKDRQISMPLSYNLKRNFWQMDVS